MKIMILALSLAGVPAFAQDPATCPLHAKHTDRVNSLSEKQIADYRAGAGMGYGMTGELNGYPGPKHVLELEASLGITAGQKSRLESSREAMQTSAARLGEEIIAKEKLLEASFVDGTVNAKTLVTMTEEIGRLQGRLRAVHLAAHLAAREILTEDQIHRYAEARGHGDAQHR